MNDRRLWTSEEDRIIEQLVREYGCKKWTVIASEMSKCCGEYSRTSKQIRERWYNHLDPEINKNPWTQSEERIIFQAHKLYGSKWKQIAKLLHARTDNSVKNHFYSTLRRSLRRINKFLGFKNSTNQMRVIKPSILSQLAESAQFNEDAKLLVARIFQFASFKPSKINMDKQSFIEFEDKIIYQNAIEKLVQFNQNYQKSKKEIRKKIKSKSKISPCQRTQTTIVEVKLEEIDKQEDLGYHHQIENQSTLSDKEKSSWSGIVSQHGMLPQLERPQNEFDFFQEEGYLQGRKQILWLDPSQQNKLSKN